MKTINCVAVLVLGVFLVPSAFSDSVFPDFCPTTGLTLNGETASLNPNADCVLRLTDNVGQSGSAFLTTPATLASDASFSSAFSFQFTHQIGGGADGMVFVVQTIANDVGGGGGGIGYAGISNSVGVEFDNWFNGGSDPDDNHVGIDLNGNVTSVQTDSISPDFDNGDIWYAWVDYNGVSDLLEVRLSQSSTRPVSANLSYVVDLVTVLGQTDAFVGFTSGTGAAGAWHDVLWWQFRDSYDPIDGPPPAAPPPSFAPIPALTSFGLALVVLVVLVLGARRLRRSA